MEFITKHWKLFVGGCVFIIAAIIGANLIIDSMKTATVNVLVAPTEAKVEIDGKVYENGVFRTFPKDNVSVKISAEYYKTQEFTVNLAANEMTNIEAILEDESGGYQSYLQSVARYEALKVVAQSVKIDEVEELIEKTEEALKIRKDLPINKNIGTVYRDSHGFYVSPNGGYTVQAMESDSDCGVIPCIEIYDSEGKYSRVKQYLESLGYDSGAYRYNEHELWLYEPYSDN